jgi:hypothetical protein
VRHLHARRITRELLIKAAVFPLYDPDQTVIVRQRHLLEISVTFLRAFPFSFAILWRYLLVLPIMIVALAAFGAVAVVFALVFGLFAPFLAILFVIAFGLASSVVPIIIGMRVGLQAKEVRPRNSYAGLMLPAIGYGFFEGLCVSIILVVCVGLFVFATPLEVADLLAMQGAEDAVIFAALFEVSPKLTLGCLIVGGGLTIALRTALLVPFAGASIGADPGGRSHTPFFGFGDGFGTMLALVIISYVGAIFTTPFVVWLAIQLGFAESLVAIAASMETIDSYTDLAAFGVEGAVILGLGLILFLWFFSLQCAGAVLVFMQRFQGAVAQKQERNTALTADLDDQPSDAPDVMQLIRSRMQNKSDENR